MGIPYEINDEMVEIEIPSYELMIKDVNNTKYIGMKVFVHSIKDEHIGGNAMAIVRKDQNMLEYYIMYNGKKIDLSNYMYLEIDNLRYILCNNVYVPLHLVASTLMKKADEITFVENRVDSNYQRKFVECKLLEDIYKKINWTYRMETVPVLEADKKQFGVEKYYLADFCKLVSEKKIHIIPGCRHGDIPDEDVKIRQKKKS